MVNTTQQVSDLEPTETMQVSQSLSEDGTMLEIEPVTPPKKRAPRASKKPEMVELDPDAIAASQAQLAESGNSTFVPEASQEVVSTASVVPEPTTVVHNTVNQIIEPQPQQTEIKRETAVMPNQRLINADFVQKTKAINSVPREVIEKRLDEIDAMFSLRRNSTGASRDNATIMLSMALWEIMGL